jgi:paraquat-inducible protein B
MWVWWHYSAFGPARGKIGHVDAFALYSNQTVAGASPTGNTSAVVMHTNRTVAEVVQPGRAVDFYKNGDKQ